MPIWDFLGESAAVQTSNGLNISDSSGISVPGSGITYILQDIFTIAYAAGSVNGTLAEPTGQPRTVTDTNSKLSISGGVASVATGGVGAGDPGLWYPAQTRAAGMMLLANFVQTAVSLEVGWDATAAGSIAFCVRSITPTLLAVRDNATAITVGATLATGIAYQVALVLRATGVWYFVKGGAFTTWTLLWVSATGNANLLPGFASVSTTDVYTVDNMRIPVATYIPSPLAYDSFTRSDGALGSTETTGPDAQALSAIAWADAIGTWAVASNKAAASATSGGVAIATISVPTKDNFIEAALTRSAGIVGVVGRYTDSDNYIYAYHDGTNAGVKQRLAGVETDLIAATAATFAANAVIRLVMDTNSCLLFYNNVRIGGTGTINAGLSGAVVGLYTTNTGNAFDLMTSWARGTGNEYSALNAF